MKGLGQNYGLKNGHWSSRNDMHRCHYLWSPGWKWCGSSFNECNSQVSSCLNLCRERRVLGSHCDTNLLMWPRLHLQLTVTMQWRVADSPMVLFTSAKDGSWQLLWFLPVVHFHFVWQNWMHSSPCCRLPKTMETYNDTMTNWSHV